MGDFKDEIIGIYKGESKPVFKLTEIDTDEYTIDLMNTLDQAGTQYAKSNIATPSEALVPTNDDKILSAKSIETVIENIDSNLTLINNIKTKLTNQIFTSNGTFTAPYDGTYKVTVCGGGGGGSRATTPNFFAGGGGVGGIAEKIVTLAKDDAVPVGVGAGGGIQTTPSIAGNNGSASSFGGYCTGNGGIGGGIAGTVIGSGGLGGTGVDGTPTGNFVGITGERGNFSFNALPSGFLSFYDTPNTLFGVSYGYGAGAVNGNPANGLAGGDGIVIVEWEEV